MKKSHLSVIFFFLILVLVGYEVYKILAPFLIAVFIAFLLSQLFNPWYVRITKEVNGRKSVGSILTCISIFLIFIIPLLIVASLVINEANGLYQSIQQNHLREKLSVVISHPLVESFRINFIGEDSETLNAESLSQGVRSVSNFLFGIIRRTYEETSNFIFMTVVTFFSLYYFFKDSDSFLKKMMQLSPLKNKQEKLILEKFLDIAKATIKGSLVVAVIQGALVGVTFAIAGIPSPVIWGLLAVLFSLLPAIGTALIWVPAAIVLFLLGHAWEGIFVMVAGTLVIGTIDNVLRPNLVGTSSSLHPLLVFLSTLGGIALFGLSGFIIGPAMVVLLITLLDIYQAEYKEELGK